ncbi:MAG TPA: glycosyltransferase [Thermodesulfobacteriota bacterium]|nr:glycosyltransferase [Thermodesulfobacteriota bacterium]
MEIAVIIEGISEKRIARQSWIYFRDSLAEKDIHILVYHGNDEAFERPFDAMLLHVWQHWANKERFDPSRIFPIIEKYAIYRAEFPETVQIVFNHTDMSRRPYATPYWRLGDPILYRTPAYNRKELYPFPEEHIWAYEHIWGEPCFVSNTPPKYKAGFIGRPSGPPGYRQSVARETAKVGIGICKESHAYSKKEYDEIMANCKIIVCPRGWGEQSQRHWDAWLSGKPVLTDRECNSVEMIPGLRLQEEMHYLVFDDPKDIPDIVSDWTRPSRLDDLAQIAESGRRAALSYDACGRIIEFFERAVK